MTRERPVRFCEGGEVRFLSATRRNIYVRSCRAGERVMASVSRFLTNKLKLKVNEAKSAVARPEDPKFLDFSISNDGSDRRIAPKGLEKFQMRIREFTRRTQIVELLRPYLIGWRSYFGFCQTPRCAHEPRSVDTPRATHRAAAYVTSEAECRAPIDKTCDSEAEHAVRERGEVEE